MKSRFVLFLMGPTCVGKSSISISLAEKFPLDIISVDSSMIYRYMNIGTDKPNGYVLKKINHHLIDIIDPSEKYSIGNFCFDSYKIMNNSILNNRIPCFVGGTMMYFWRIQNGLFFLSKINSFLNSNKKLSDHFIYNNNSLFFLDEYFSTLFKYSKINYYDNNIDNYFLLNSNYFNLFNCKLLNVIIYHDDKFSVYKLIANRIDKMFDCGFIDEVLFLYKRGDLNLKMQSIKSIGYKQIWLYLDGKISFFEAKNDIIKITKFLFKKQLTWLKIWNSNAYYLNMNSKNIVDNIISLLI